MSTSETQLRASAKLPPVERKVQVKPVVGEKSLTTNRRSCERSCIGAPPHCCMVDRVSDSNFAHRTKSNPLIAIVHLGPPVRCSLRRWHSSSLSLWQFSPNEPELFESRLLLDSPFAGLTFAGLNFCWIHLLLVNSSPWHTPGLVAMCVDSLRSSCIVVASTLHRSRN